jgi:transferrin binding protein
MASKRAVLCSMLLALTATACGGGGSSSGAAVTMPLSGAAPKPGAGSGAAASSGSQSTTTSGMSVSGVNFQSSNSPLAPSQGAVTGGALNYSSFGIWSEPGGTTGAFTTGTPTPTNALPMTGKATYTGGAVGTASDGTTSTQLAGAFAATTDFGNRTVAGGVTLNQVGAGGASTPYDSYNFNANLAANSSNFSGAMTAVNNKAMSGTTIGSIIGPQGQEMAGGFSLQGGGTTVVGSYGGSTTAQAPTPVAGSFTGSFSGAVNFTANAPSTSGMTAATGTLTLQSANTISGTISGTGKSTLPSALTGTVTGSLFGPAAAIAGMSPLSGGTTTAIGAFGGAKH